MKIVFYFSILFLLIVPIDAAAQGFLKSDYITSSSLKDEKGNRYGSGDLFKISGRYTLPLSVRQNSSGQLSAWSATFYGSYGLFDNKKIRLNTIPDKIINANISLSHLRPLSEKWYLIASLGGGIYAEPDDVSAKSILVNGGVFFVYKLINNLDLGIGAALTNSYGVPVIMPTSYVKWQLTGRYEVKANLANNMEISASAKLSDNFHLRLVAMEMDGMSAVMDIDGKSMIYSSTNMKSYLTPEYRKGKSTFYLGMGGVWMRSSKLSRRTLKGFWNSFKKDDDDMNFNPACYFIVGFKYGI